ncbi:histone H3.v1-like [Onthophagus taurus]|uniref:histone H3.v1-like n=1 Tax=Onthophagus taurus TaxID=166361 RepID=UPI0039BE3254
MVFVGYSNNGLRFFDEGKRKIIISRDAIFENKKVKILIEDTSDEEKDEDKINTKEEEKIREEEENNNENVETTETEAEEPKEEEEKTNGRPQRSRRPPTKLRDYAYLNYEEGNNE